MIGSAPRKQALRLACRPPPRADLRGMKGMRDLLLIYAMQSVDERSPGAKLWHCRIFVSSWAVV